MFQFAFAKSLSLKYNSEIYFDLSFYEHTEKSVGFTPRKFELNIFNLEYKIADRAMLIKAFKYSKFRKYFGNYFFKVINENYFEYNENLMMFKPPLYLSGYFQSEKYFYEHRKIIKDQYSLLLTHSSFDFYKTCDLIFDVNSVSVHIRRGDYVGDLKTNNFHGVCSLDYYYQAFNYINKRIDNPIFFVFSDDILWAENNLDNSNYNLVFPKVFENSNSGTDMILMSKCKHNITANSSYSWWSAWLNENPNKITIVPKNWFLDKSINTGDLIPESWVQM